ncbi:LYR motif-containing protein 1 isoform X2 [Suricata suricatta]|uniref:LYR motif-containing protein 1 isoform X2 n=1 Tax=Suricata suricatta TaxID=37032 RepID=UPI0011552F08|nr:LYR motif-containing protein 1 isoform X2 [Suricata suricatta]
MFPQRSSRWFGPAWPTGPDRPQSAAALLGSRRRLLLARAVSAFGLVRRVFTWETWPTYHQKAKPHESPTLGIWTFLRPESYFYKFHLEKEFHLCSKTPQCSCCDRLSKATRQEVLGLYRRIFRLVRKWQAASGQMEDTIKEKQYILNEARTLFQKNKNLTDTELIKQCIDECTARIEIGLHYQIPYPRPIHLPPMGLTPLRGRGLRSQEKLRKLSKPVYLKSHDEIS